MNQAQYEVRNEHPGNGALIASKTEEGFRVYSLENPSRVYLVRNEDERWTCTCPDFVAHQSDTTWRCQHVLAVGLVYEIIATDIGQSLSVKSIT